MESGRALLAHWTKVQVGGRAAEGYSGLVREHSPSGAEEVQKVSETHRFSTCHVRRLPALIAAVAVLVLGALPALAQDAAPPATSPVVSPTGPLALVKGSVTRALSIAESQGDDAQRRVELRQVGEALFDFHEMGRRALGQHWAGRSPQEQDEFVRLFTDLLERSYLLAIGNRGAGTVTFQGESVEGSAARVRSRLVTNRGAEIPIEFRLLERGGRWAVYDLVVEGVSLISSYRSQFNSIIRNSSFARLLEKLSGRETPQGSGEKP
ncbi:MAG TPA: ABC transporter substrate-binding protein [Methylomirabilota bacterium]|nr:ABC transporter substrate-binding protein [Methylomirabilota bacterium]